MAQLTEHFERYADKSELSNKAATSMVTFSHSIPNHFCFSVCSSAAAMSTCRIRECRRVSNLYSIPAGTVDDGRRKQWLLYCRKGTGELKRGRICEIHFSPSQMVVVNGKSYLKHDAVPDQHLPGYVKEHF